MNKHDVNAAVLAAQRNAEGALSIYELECLGYTVDAVAHHPGEESKFRWINTHTFESQIEAASGSEAETWARAAEAWGDKHERKDLPGGAHCGELTPARSWNATTATAGPMEAVSTRCSPAPTGATLSGTERPSRVIGSGWQARSAKASANPRTWRCA